MKFETTRSTHFEDTTAHDIVVYTFFNKKLVKYRGDAFFREGAGICGFRAKVGKDASLIGRFYTTLFSGKKKRHSLFVVSLVSSIIQLFGMSKMQTRKPENCSSNTKRKRLKS